MRPPAPGRLTRSGIALLLAVAWPVGAVIVPGGAGSRLRDCVSVFDVPAANTPPPPRPATRVDCVDGDPACDADGARDAACVFTLRVCVNSTANPACVPERADAVVVTHAQDDGDPRFDTDFQAVQSRVDGLGFPGNATPDDCTVTSSIGVRLVPPRSGSGPWGKGRKTLRLAASGRATGRLTVDKDRLALTCRPAGDGLYAPRDLYAGTFDRIAREIFQPRCATSGCHDSESHQANQILLPNVAWSQIVGVTPTTAAAASDGLERVLPGDPGRSLLYRKITFDLPAGYGTGMPQTGPPLGPAQVELIRLWILGDGLLGPAPATGWVAGTDG